MFGIYKKLARLKRIEQIVHKSYRGVVKRVDENRELLELLQQEAPEFLHKHPWVEGWLHGQDGFLTELMAAAEVQAQPTHTERQYPRPWPGRSAIDH
jgi:hypothetical protein